MRNQNKRQTNGFFALIEAFNLSDDDVIVVITKNSAVEKILKKLTKYSKWRLNVGHIDFFKCP